MAGRPPRTLATEAVVLRRRPTGDADAIVVLFTPGEGRLDAVARGVRKPQSKMRGHIEPVTRSRFLLAHGRTLDVITQAETADAFLGAKSSLDALAAAMYCCELTERFTAERSPQPDLYLLLVDALCALDRGSDPALVSRYFELHLLAVSGYELQVTACASCGSDLPEADAFLAPAAGGLLCPGCRVEQAGRLLSVRAQKVLRFARRASVGEFCLLRMPTDVAAEVRAALGEAVRAVLDAEPRTARFVDLLAAPP
jgi:DNA repair protein RecO (recombination protein O)